MEIYTLYRGTIQRDDGMCDFIKAKKESTFGGAFIRACSEADAFIFDGTTGFESETSCGSEKARETKS